MKVNKKDSINDEKDICYNCGDCNIYCAIENEYTISSSSFLSSSGNINYAPNNIDDNNLKTAWVEGKDGFGIGESIEYEFNKSDFSRSSIQITGLSLINGYRKSLKSWEENARIKKLKIKIKDKDFAILELHNTYKSQSCKLKPSNLKELKKIRFEIVEVYPGDRFKDVALSELFFEGIHHH